MCTAGSGDVAQLILDEAAKVPGTLVAITSHGRSAVMRALLGSTALNVLRAGREPLLVYRPPTDEGEPVPRQIDRIVVPLDGSIELSESIEPLAAEFARWIGARIVVASVVDPMAREAVPDAASSDVVESGYVHARAAHLAERYGIDLGWEVLHGDPETAIPNFVGSLANTMLAMTTRGRSAVQSALLGSVTAASLRDGGRTCADLLRLHSRGEDAFDSLSHYSQVVATVLCKCGGNCTLNWIEHRHDRNHDILVWPLRN